MLSSFGLCLLAVKATAAPVEERGVVGHLLSGPSVTINMAQSTVPRFWAWTLLKAFPTPNHLLETSA